ncbi:DUF2079 domain-containing protein [Streptomyces mobaraensis]|uniref:DUF2079 domain-containing protein n=1 Tax=Streptomyces mobaraensis TaxID=35621 RepID=A0A5N5W212_STRMB|nr:DUF2079 domain-containing protein [Streptomyces mobaraensis]KAB7835143.1 DUF2079 domain-containing protein [Streptomyces mobaraensis]
MDSAAAPVSAPGPDTAIAPAEGRAWTSTLRAPRLDPYWVAGALFLLYTALSVTRHRRMLTMSWDIGIFEQAIRTYAHFQAPVADLKGPGANILGDHFSPITALVAPFYRLFPSPVTLLVVQAALFALSAVPVVRLAAGKLGRTRGLAIGIAYGFSWGIQRAVDFDFHEIAFAMPLLAFSLEAVVRRRWRTALWWALPLVLVKEDLGVTVAAIGAAILLLERRDRRHGPDGIPRDTTATTVGGILVVFGLAASALALGVAIPSFNNTGSYGYWNKIDGGSTATIPPLTAARTLLWILLPTTGLLALRSPVAIVALPTLAWRFVSHDDHYWGTDWHYNAVLMPIVLIALTDALATAHRSPRAWLRRYARQLPAAVAGAALALSASLPLYTLTEPATYEIPASVKATERLLARIPDGATVEASDVAAISRLTGRCRVFWFGDTQGITPSYITERVDDGRPVKDLVADAARRHPGARYDLLGVEGTTVVLKRAA